MATGVAGGIVCRFNPAGLSRAASVSFPKRRFLPSVGFLVFPTVRPYAGFRSDNLHSAIMTRRRASQSAGMKKYRRFVLLSKIVYLSTLQFGILWHIRWYVILEYRCKLLINKRDYLPDMATHNGAIKRTNRLFSGLSAHYHRAAKPERFSTRKYCSPTFARGQHERSERNLRFRLAYCRIYSTIRIC